MPLYPASNDSYNDLLYKLARNLYGIALLQGATGLTEPVPGWTDFAYLKSALESSANIT